MKLSAKVCERALALALLIVTVFSVFTPIALYMPGRAVDAAWALGMNEAAGRGMSFGHDILFTFGPYASVFTRAYHPAIDWTCMFAGLWFVAVYAYTAVIATRNASRLLPWALFVVIAIMHSWDGLWMSYTLVASVYLIRAEQVSSRSVVIVMAPFGLLPLIKGSFAVLCALLIVIVATSRLLAKDRRGAIAAIASPAVVTIAFWLLARQSLLSLAGYARCVLHLAAGYSDAMSITGDSHEVIAYLIASLAMLATILLERGSARTSRLTAAAFAAFLFVAFKAGFVRHDAHALICSASILLAGAVHAGFVMRWWRFAATIASVGAWWLIESHYGVNTWAELEDTYTRPVHGTIDRIWGDHSYAELYDATLDAIAKQVHLRPLAGTTDIYSTDQADVIASRAHWDPRPVVQSYAAYDRFLADRNRDHLLGDSAPDNIVFRVEPIDGHPPSLEDGPSWWPLLTRYQPTAFDGTLYVHRRASSAPIPQLEPFGETTGNVGWKVQVPPTNALLFAEIDLEPTLLGRLASTLYKLPPVLIAVKLASDPGLETNIAYRYIPSMGRLGFLLSPLVQTTEQVSRLYGPRDYLARQRVAWFKIAPTGGSFWWKRTFRVRFTQLDLAPSFDPRSLYKLAKRLDSAPGEAEHCDNVIDQLDGAAPPGEYNAVGVLLVRGWAAHDTHTPAKTIAIALTDEHGDTQIFAAEREQRPDVAEYFHDPAMADTGYSAAIDVADLNGRFVIGPAVGDGNELAICPGRNHTIVVHPIR